MRNWSLSRKIWLIVGILVFSFMGTMVFQYIGISRMKSDLDKVTKVVVLRAQMAARIRDNQRRIRIAAGESVIYTKPEKLQTLDKAFNEGIEKQKTDLKAYGEIASAEEQEELKKYTEYFEILAQLLTEVKNFGVKGQHDKAQEKMEEAETIVALLSGSLDKLVGITERELKEESEAASAAAHRTLILTMTVASSAIVTALIIAFFVLQSVTRAIREVVSNLFDTSAQVSSAAAQISGTSESLSQSSSEQAAALEETAAAIEEMNSMVAKNSQNAGLASATSTKSQNKAAEGKNVVEKMIQSMDNINNSNNAIMEQVNSSNQRFAEIVKVIEEIATKTNVINDIVFQTKLLSFNASVEAARAGEHGKGFAVVAEEVGNLAQMSGNAAKEISTLLDDSVHKVNEIVGETKSKVEHLINEGRSTVEEGAEVARQCGAVLEEIVANVSHVSQMSTEIASASDEQSRGVAEITKAMSQLDQMTQTNAATSEESASAAEELSAQATSLKSAVGRLVLTVEGSKASTEMPESKPVSRNDLAPKSPKSKVTPFAVKPKMTKSTVVQAAPAKKVSGDQTPSYDSEGFQDI